MSTHRTGLGDKNSFTFVGLFYQINFIVIYSFRLGPNWISKQEVIVACLQRTLGNNGSLS